VFAVMLLGQAVNPRRTIAQTPNAAAPLDSTRGVPALHDAELAGLKVLGVYDDSTGAWISGAVIRDTLGHEIATSRIGVASLNALAALGGFYLLEVTKPGYLPRRLMLRADTTAEFMIALEPRRLGSASLAAVKVTAEFRLDRDAGMRDGFTRRCADAVIECVGPKVLDRPTLSTIRDALKGLSTVHEDCTVPREGPVFSPRRVTADGFDQLNGCVLKMHGRFGGAKGCVPTYFVNGYEWTPLGGLSEAQLNTYFMQAGLAGVEVYDANAPRPARFEPGKHTECGVIVLWTR
jgi:hypothetical protein